jgi:hypothetical protein
MRPGHDGFECVEGVSPSRRRDGDVMQIVKHIPIWAQLKSKICPIPFRRHIYADDSRAARAINGIR